MTAPVIATDVMLIGAGAAGLFCALHLPRGTDVLVVDKGARGQGSSPWAQGGVAAALGPEDSPELHAIDTMRVAAGHADRAAVSVLCEEAPECVMELSDLGCRFHRGADGSLSLAREGGQSVARSANSGDATGAAIMEALRNHARPPRIEGTCVALAIGDGRCFGGWVMTDEGLVEIRANSTILATGGAGALFRSTTNPPGATGDGIALAWEAGARVADLEFIQFHPTALDAGEGNQRVLITEALRGAGAHVVDSEGRRFLFEHHSDGELAPRDVVARAVSSRRAWLDCRHLGRDLLEAEFPTVLEGCRANGLDPTTEQIPITPAAHYLIGGIQTDLDGRASIPRLYAIGECSNTGVHGANRLAGNSLAEALVFGRRAARAIAGQRTRPIKRFPKPPDLAVTGSASADWARLRAVCSDALGITRDPTTLQEAERELERLALAPLTPDVSECEHRGAAIAARLMVHSALLRSESRGVHYRSDHPEPQPEWAGVRLTISRN
jgi:L-aspartate oxidase